MWMSVVKASAMTNSVDQIAALLGGQVDPRELELRLRARLCQDSLKEFVKTFWHVIEPGRELIWGWPIEAICDHLEAVTRGEIKRLLITVPPGSSKSLLTRVFWPTWEWAINPSRRYIGASYAQHLAERDNRRARSIVQSDLYKKMFDHVKMSDEQATKTNFANTSTGWMFATSVQGLGTGERGDRFIIDDAHNVSKAESAQDRQRVLLWFSETVPSRLNDLDKDAIVAIMQRVHQDDLAQAAIDRRYEHLLIPMHYDSSRAKTTIIGWSDPRTEEGQLMWPERFSAGAVADLEDALGPYASAAQLEQEPVPRQGGLFTPENIVEVEELPDTEADYEFVRAWDLAASEGAGAYTVGVKMGRNLKNGNFYIVDVKRKRLGPDGVRKMITGAAAEDGAGVPIRIPQDPGQAGKAQVASIISELAGYNARAEAQSGSKETRAEPLAAQVEAGNVRILTRGWTKAFLEEMRFFPRGKYKDQVDAASSAFNALATKRKRGIGGLFALGDKQRNAARPF